MPYKATILAQHGAEVSDSSRSGYRCYGAEREPVGVSNSHFYHATNLLLPNSPVARVQYHFLLLRKAARGRQL